MSRSNLQQQLQRIAQRRRIPFGPRQGSVPLPGAPRLAIAPAALEDPEETAVRLRRIEALLFLAREPLPSRKLSQHANLADATEARTLIRLLNARYDDLGSAFRAEEVAGGYQLLTRPKFSSWLRRLDHVPREVRLSAPSLETLAVVAYRQPIGRAEVEAIRGVSCGEILRQLLDRDLIRIQGRSEELGRPFLYATTKRFLQVFGLRNVDKLPRASELQKTAGVAQDTCSGKLTSDSPESSACNREDSVVTIANELSADEAMETGLTPLLSQPRAADDDYDFEDEFEDDDEADDEDDEDGDDDFDDYEDDEDDDEDDEDDDFDPDEEDDWEEVGDDDEDEDDEDEEWDDDDFDDEDDDFDDDVEEDDDWEEAEEDEEEEEEEEEYDDKWE